MFIRHSAVARSKPKNTQTTTDLTVLHNKLYDMQYCQKRLSFSGPEYQTILDNERKH